MPPAPPPDPLPPQAASIASRNADTQAGGIRISCLQSVVMGFASLFQKFQGAAPAVPRETMVFFRAVMVVMPR